MKNKILIIEDDPFLADIYATKFNQEGFSVGIAADGELGFKKIQEEKPDIVLLDIVLPKMDGLEVLKKAKEAPELKSIPIVLLTNLGQEGEIKRGLEAGAIQYLIKAHHAPGEVVNLVKKILENKK